MLWQQNPSIAGEPVAVKEKDRPGLHMYSRQTIRDRDGITLLEEKAPQLTKCLQNPSGPVTV